MIRVPIRRDAGKVMLKVFMKLKAFTARLAQLLSTIYLEKAFM